MKDAFTTAVKLLSRRAHAKGELHKKLCDKGFPPSEADFAIAECLRFGFLDDSAFAVALTDEMLARGCGSRKIRFNLSRRGVDKETASAALESVPDRTGSIDELSSAIEALGRKLKSFEREADSRKRRLKAMRFLAGRGFGSEIVSKAIEAHAQAFKRSPSEGF